MSLCYQNCINPCYGNLYGGYYNPWAYNRGFQTCYPYPGYNPGYYSQNVIGYDPCDFDCFAGLGSLCHGGSQGWRNSCYDPAWHPPCQPTQRTRRYSCYDGCDPYGPGYQRSGSNDPCYSTSGQGYQSNGGFGGYDPCCYPSGQSYQRYSSYNPCGFPSGQSYQRYDGYNPCGFPSGQSYQRYSSYNPCGFPSGQSFQRYQRWGCYDPSGYGYGWGSKLSNGSQWCGPTGRPKIDPCSTACKPC